MKKILYISIILILLTLFASPAYAEEPIPELYEYLNIGGDGDSQDIYGANWVTQQFTSDNFSHEVTSIRVPLKRTGAGDPGIVTLSITNTSGANTSTGADLATAYMYGEDIATDDHTWYDFDIDDIIINGDSRYCIVVRATSASSTNYIEWRKDSGGGLDEAVGSSSTDSGITWSSDSPVDYLFEIWGNPVIEIEQASVFSGYVEDDDWLITIAYRNTYRPYYPTYNPKSYFVFQLYDGATLIAQTNCPMWGYRPACIYLSSEITNSLDWGADDYTVRLLGIFGNSPYTDYVLESGDWEGDSLDLLDEWVIALAKDIEEEDESTLVVDIAGQGEALNETGHVIFTNGISYLSSIRPDLFEMIIQNPMGEDDSHTIMTEDPETELGTEIHGVFEDWGEMFNASPEEFANIGLMTVFIVLLAVGAMFNMTVVAFGIGFVGLIATSITGITDYALLGIATFLGIFIFLFSKLSNR